MSEQELNYVTIPRQIRWDWENGLMTTPERNLLYVLRSQGVPQGFCSVDMESLARDTFNTAVSRNYINRLLLSLRSKRYIWYKDRKGHRGTFQVQLDTWLMKNKSLRTLGQYFEQTPDTVTGTAGVVTKAEVSTDNPHLSQKSTETMEAIRAMLSGQNESVPVRGSYNKKEKKKEKENN